MLSNKLSGGRKGSQRHSSVFMGLIPSSYQTHCQGLQSCTVVHISLYDIRLLRDDGKGAATVTVRDEGHTLVLEYHFCQCHKDKYRFHLHLIYSLLTTTGSPSTAGSFTFHLIIFYIRLIQISFKWMLFNSVNAAVQQQGGAQTPLLRTSPLHQKWECVMLCGHQWVLISFDQISDQFLIMKETSFNSTLINSSDCFVTTVTDHGVGICGSFCL